MSSFFKSIIAFSLQFFATSLLSQKVQAQGTKDNFDSAIYTQNVQQYVMDNVPSVSELSDIKASNWKFQLLNYLIQRYRIETSYPLEIYQRQGVIKRYEFTVLLNEVIQHINQLHHNQQANFATKEELEALGRLQKEFASELGTIDKRIDTLELKQNNFPQFSTTSTLTGEVISVLTAVGEGKKAGENEKTDSNITFSSRTKLELNTSFTGKDRLEISLRARNIESLDSATGTDMARLSSQGNNDNILDLGDLLYRFSIGDRTQAYIATNGLAIEEFTDSINPFLDGTDDGAVSRFAQRNPIYRQGGGAGIGLKYEISDNLEFGMGYVADDAENPEIGLDQSNYAAIAQFTFESDETLLIGLNYIHSYNNIDTNTGSDSANNPFNDDSESITANSFGLQASVGINQNLFLGGWVGYTTAKSNDLPDKPTANIFNWAVTLALPDLGKEGNLGGIIIGQPPKLIDNQYQSDGEEYTDKDTSLHLEAFYRFNINKNIAITPGIVIITNPEHNNDNDTIYLGTLRTTFSF